MIDILIMDDSDQKVGELRQVVTTVLPDGEVNIDTAPNIFEGRTLMQARQYDLLVLDMVMPNHVDEEQSHTAGAEYLDEIYQHQDSTADNRAYRIREGVYTATTGLSRQIVASSVLFACRHKVAQGS